MSAARKLPHPEFELFGTSLSGRVLWFTVAIILLVELVILLPGLGRERQDWLWQRASAAHLAAFCALQDTGVQDAATRDVLLGLAGAEAVELAAPGESVRLGRPGPWPAPERIVELGSETLGQSTIRAMLAVAGFGGGTIEMVAASPLRPRAVLRVMLNRAALTGYLRNYALHIAVLSVIVALVTGLLVFAALDRLLVRPMRIMTASIVGFRQDPERAEQDDLIWLAKQRDDEIAAAARELKIMQDEMRGALWRNARLAAVGTSVAKISHDLRNILSSALLVTDRLQATSDPVAQRAAKTLIPAVERAAQLVSRTVDFAREGPPAIIRSAVGLRELVEEATLVVRPDESGPQIVNLVPASLVLPLDRAQIYRVLLNLMRNAADAGAEMVTVSVRGTGGVTKMRVADDGPGLPLRVQDNLFKPFSASGRRGGSGLGLAIARDLIRAHGGDLILAETGPRGTVFEMDLMVSEVAV